MGEASASELNPEPIQDLRAMRGQSVSRTLRTFRPILLLFKLWSLSSNLFKARRIQRFQRVYHFSLFLTKQRIDSTQNSALVSPLIYNLSVESMSKLYRRVKNGKLLTFKIEFRRASNKINHSSISLLDSAVRNNTSFSYNTCLCAIAANGWPPTTFWRA